MTKNEILELLKFDQAHVSYNPYFFGNQYEEKGVLVLLKFEKGKHVLLSDIENLCFQCPTLEYHPDLISILLFSFDKNDMIYDYNIASIKFKISRSDVLKYERLIGRKID